MIRRQRQGGFGLAEVLLASGVLILVVASVVALSRFVIRGYALTASRTQATYLAQEGLERARNIRDSYGIDECAETDFTDFVNGTYRTSWNIAPTVTDCSGLPARWELAAATSPAETIPAGIVGPMTFTRDITIADPPDLGDQSLNDNTKLVTVTVSWIEGGRTWDVRAETYLTNWKPES